MTGTKVKDWLKSHNICGYTQWFDKETVYYSLTEEQIIRLAKHLSKKTPKHETLTFNKLDI